MNSTLAFLAAARQCEIHDLEHLARSCDLVQAVSELVHRLQGERGASNLFLASGGEVFVSQREACVALSAQAEAALRSWLAQVEGGQDAPIVAVPGGARLFTRIAVALHALDGLAELRAEVAARRCKAADATLRFNRMVAALLALVFEAADVAADPAVSRLLVALFNLMQGKEHAGQERAAGAAAFAAGAAAASTAAAGGQDLLHLIDAQEACFERFEAFCPTELLGTWAQAKAAMPMGELERMRRRLLAAAQGAVLDPAQAQAWFACCSQRLELIRDTEAALAQGLRAACLQRIAALQADPDDPQSLLRALAAQPEPVSPSGVLPMEDGVEALGPRLRRSIVDALHAQAQRLQAMNDELAAVRTALDERKLIERAKGELMRHQGLAEDEAYRLLRRTAMNQGRRLVDVAQAVLAMSDLLPPRS
ncbi:ANTAR domain-containing protein [Thauera sp. 27]|uniref:nitrate regulatory protein n=1 Tax=Thauera sp. 27 TaxID=305700 RepID=UPI0002D09408|nr:nitrate regulatory protein [Thauera sp. 27]ENO77072.1 ANTAR domain-containing protein [Thauera sp. 27]